MNQGMTERPNVQWTNGTDHWIDKGIDGVRLFAWRKTGDHGNNPRGAILFVHGSSMASQPTFDLQIQGRESSSVMDYFVSQGFDTWCLDNEGYGRSSKDRDINCDIANGADDLAAASEYICKVSNVTQLMVYGISSGSLKAGLFAQLHPERVARVALDAFVWTGNGSHTLERRRERLDEWKGNNRRAIDREFVHKIFTRDQPGTADYATVDAFADAILTLDDSVPTGTYVDMTSKLPLVDPTKLLVPTLIMRGQYDGGATDDDLLAFFKQLPNPDKQFTVLPGMAHASFQQKNYLLAYHVLLGFFTRPPLAYVPEIP